MAAKKKSGEPVSLEALVSAAQATLAQDGAVKVSKLGPSSARQQVRAQLLALGYEATASIVRRPIKQQILDALQHGASVSTKSLPSHVVGASKPELTSACSELVKDRAALLVLRGKEQTLVAPGTSVVSVDALRRLQTQLKALTKVIGDALKKPGAALLPADVHDALAQLSASAGAARKPEPATMSTTLDRVLRAVDDARDEQMGLSFVPQILQSLRAEVDTAAAKAALLEAAARGLLELRPEGGLGRLSPEELELCPPGPQGTRLSWARRNGGARP